MAEKLPNLNKTLLVIILVLTPPFWLLFTDEGSRVSDTALMWLMGKDEIKVNIPELDDKFTEQDIRSVFKEIDWHCGAQQTPFGDAVCAAEIGVFNGFPAQLITFYFRDGRVSALKLIYRDQYHQQILGHYIGELGQPGNVAAAIAEGPDADTVLEWDLGRGVLILKKELGKLDEPALIWLAAKPQ
jgi:hypothetical protein